MVHSLYMLRLRSKSSIRSSGSFSRSVYQEGAKAEKMAILTHCRLFLLLLGRSALPGPRVSFPGSVGCNNLSLVPIEL